MKKMNNKGFSLVELIIVIAIMAILVGVLAPQYMKYVEKSRVSTDIQTLESIKSAIQTVVVDPSVDVSGDIELEMTKSGTGAPSGATLNSTIKTAIEEITGDLTKVKAKSDKCNNAKITYTKSTNTITVTIGSTVYYNLSDLAN